MVFSLYYTRRILSRRSRQIFLGEYGWEREFRKKEKLPPGLSGGSLFGYRGASSATRWLRVTMPFCARIFSAASLSSTRKTTQALPWERVMKA